jgi:hypothetical protein
MAYVLVALQGGFEKMNQVVTHCTAFLVGVFMGAAGKYLGDKFTDQRRRKEAESKRRKDFRQLKLQMPELFRAMAEDVSAPDQGFIREFFLLESRKGIFNAGQRCFAYYGEDHVDLAGKIHILENMGYVTNITTPGKAPKYRMTEEFIALLRERG